MAITESDYFHLRADLLNNHMEKIVELERRYMELLNSAVLKAAPSIFKDFDQVVELYPFWANYPPEQRGRQPKGDAIPWGDMGEKVIHGSVIKAILEILPGVEFPGLPLGGDIRFATKEAIIHFDLKLTGPRDNPDEVVASPHQISGDGAYWLGDGFLNSSVVVQGQRATMPFQPTLPPFYVLDGTVRVCLTYFLKAVYTLVARGHQPLTVLELACVPNGLLSFDGPKYGNYPDLFIPGKDDKTTPVRRRRTRVRLGPLSQIANWRCRKITVTNGVASSNLRDLSLAIRLNL